jgi:D-sedoheptulose 7-phosphate isomerase
MFSSLHDLIAADLTEAMSLRDRLAPFIPQLEKASELCVQSLQQGGKIILFGNGGSAADAQHIAAEFVGRFEKERAAWPALALSTNTSALTAIGNDYSYDDVFSRQVEALVGAHDVVIGISTSGNSKNVLKGLEAARAKGAKTIGMSGEGGVLQKHVDLAIAVPTSHTPRVQELHILFGHAIAHAVECALTGDIRS